MELSLKRTTEIAAGLAGIALQIFFWWPSLGKIAAGHNDFLTLYAGGRLVGSGQLYDAARNAQVELATGGATGRVLRYIRPPFQAVMFRPLAALPFLLAYRIYVLLSLFALVGFVLLGRDRTAPRWPWPAAGLFLFRQYLPTGRMSPSSCSGLRWPPAGTIGVRYGRAWRWRCARPSSSCSC